MRESLKPLTSMTLGFLIFLLPKSGNVAEVEMAIKVRYLTLIKKMFVTCNTIIMFFSVLFSKRHTHIFCQLIDLHSSFLFLYVCVAELFRENVPTLRDLGSNFTMVDNIGLGKTIPACHTVGRCFKKKKKHITG